MSVHLRSVLVKSPVEMLRAFLTGFSPSGFGGIDWQESRRALAEVLVEVIHSLELDVQDRIYSAVDQIGQFMNEHGRQVLRSVLSSDPLLWDEFDAQLDVIGCAIYVRQVDEDVFDQALAAMYVQRLLNGRNWTGLDFEGGHPPAMRSELRLSDLEGRLQQIFASDGPTPRVVVERFSRHDRGSGASGIMIREQFTIYIEAPPETSLAFVEDMKIEPRITRPVLEGALILDAVEGTLDIVCKRAGKERRREIAEAFLDTILEPGTELATRSRRTLNLDKLKRRQTFDLRTDDRVLRVEVIALTLASPDSAAIVSFEARGAVQGSGRSDFYDRAKETFGNYGVMESAGWQVKFAKLRVVFEPERERARAKSVALELRAPDRTNLRDQLELHRHIADTLLYRWGLYADQE